MNGIRGNQSIIPVAHGYNHRCINNSYHLKSAIGNMTIQQMIHSVSCHFVNKYQKGVQQKWLLWCLSAIGNVEGQWTMQPGNIMAIFVCICQIQDGDATSTTARHGWDTAVVYLAESVAVQFLCNGNFTVQQHCQCSPELPPLVVRGKRILAEVATHLYFEIWCCLSLWNW